MKANLRGLVQRIVGVVVAPWSSITNVANRVGSNPARSSFSSPVFLYWEFSKTNVAFRLQSPHYIRHLFYQTRIPFALSFRMIRQRIEQSTHWVYSSTTIERMSCFLDIHFLIVSKLCVHMPTMLTKKLLRPRRQRVAVMTEMKVRIQLAVTCRMAVDEMLFPVNNNSTAMRRTLCTDIPRRELLASR